MNESNMMFIQDIPFWRTPDRQHIIREFQRRVPGYFPEVELYWLPMTELVWLYWVRLPVLAKAIHRTRLAVCILERGLAD